MQKTIKQLILLIIILTIMTLICINIGFGITFKVLLAIMIMDYLLGIFLAIQGKSKHGDGFLSSAIGFFGLTKKISIIILVTTTALINKLLVQYGISFDYIQDIIIVAFILNETMSIVENANTLGLQIPQIVINMINVIKQMKIKK